MRIQQLYAKQFWVYAKEDWATVREIRRRADLKDYYEKCVLCVCVVCCLVVVPCIADGIIVVYFVVAGGSIVVD